MNKALKVGGVVVLALVALAAGVALTAGGPNALAEQAYEAYQAGELEQARVTYEAALAQNPEHAPSVIGLAEVAIDEQDPDRIRRYGERAIAASDDPVRRARLRLALARTWVDDGEFTDAIAMADLADDDDPSLAGEAQGVQGLAKLGAGEADKARALLEAASAAGSTDSRVYSALTQLQLAAGQGAEARTSAERAVELAGEDPALWVIVADLRARDGDAVAARAGLERAVELEPGNVSARVGLAQHQLDADDLSGAMATARAAHEASPDDPMVRRILARALVAAGQADEALTLLEAVEAVGWRDQLELGAALLAAGRQQAGQEAIAAAAAKRPNDLEAQLAAGRACLSGGVDATPYYRTALELGTDYGARVGLAKALAALDRTAHHAEIVDQLEAAHAQTPERLEAPLGLAEHLVEVGAADRAAELLAKVSAADARVSFWRGRAALALEAWDDAIAALEACEAQGGVPELDRWLLQARERR